MVADHMRENRPSKDDQFIRMVSVGDATSVSSDGRLITFTDWGTGKIMLRNIRSGETTALTPGGYPDYGMFAQISPNGSSVAYSWWVAGGYFDLRIAKLDGAEPTVLLDGNAIGDSFFVMDWSPDGQEILVLSSKQLALVSVGDGAIREIHSFEKRLFTNWARFSPDGELIAFDVRPAPMESSGNLSLYSLDQGKVIASISHPSDDRLMGWMPDGKWLLFCSDRDGGHGLWAVPVRGKKLGAPVRLLPSLGKAHPWSIDVTEDGSLFYAVRTWEVDLFIADYDSETASIGEPHKLGSDVNYGSAPAWSPDGNSLIYSRYPSILVLRSYPDGREKEIRVGLRRFHGIRPHWSSDGRSILVEARPDGSTAGLVAVDMETGEVTPLIHNDRDGVVDWATGSPTEIVYFARYEVGGSGRIVELDIRTGEEKDIYSFVRKPNYPIFRLALSQDGNRLVYLERLEGEVKATAIMVLEVKGGEPKQVFQVEEPEVLYQPAWTPDGRFILFGRGSSDRIDSELQLWRLDVSTGQAVRLRGAALPGRNMNGLSVHPDGKRIIFTTGRIVPEGVGGHGVEARDEVRVVENIAALIEGSQ